MRSLMLLPLLLALAACHPDPFAVEGTWHPTNVNDANLREMVANPHDLVAGQAATGSWGQEAAAAVQRVVDDKTRGLISATTSNAVAAPSGGAQ